MPNHLATCGREAGEAERANDKPALPEHIPIWIVLAVGIVPSANYQLHHLRCPVAELLQAAESISQRYKFLRTLQDSSSLLPPPSPSLSKDLPASQPASLLRVFFFAQQSSSVPTAFHPSFGFDHHKLLPSRDLRSQVTSSHKTFRLSVVLASSISTTSDIGCPLLITLSEVQHFHFSSDHIVEMEMQLPSTTYTPPTEGRRVRNASGNAAPRVVSGPVPTAATRGELQASAMPRNRNVSGGSMASVMTAPASDDDESVSGSSSGQRNSSDTAQTSRPSTAASGQRAANELAAAPVPAGRIAASADANGQLAHREIPANAPDLEQATVDGAERHRPAPLQAILPRVRVLAAIASPLRLNDGTVIHPEILVPMAQELETARNEGRFPDTTTSYMNAQAVLDDYMHLQDLEGLERGSRQHNELYIENVRRIQERDSVVVHDNHDAHYQQVVDNMMRNQAVGDDLHALIRHAARAASANAVERVLARHNQQAPQGNMVREIVQGLSQDVNFRGVLAGHGLDMEAILEDVFAVIEARLLDAAGPLRLNVNNLRNMVDNNLNGQVNNLRNIAADQQATHAAAENQINNLTTQVGAMNNNLTAVGNHTNALGALMQALNNTAIANNTQMGQLGNEVNGLQQITNMLPGLVQQVVQQVIQQILPGAIQAGLVQAVSGAAQSGNGKGNNASVSATDVTTAMGEKGNSSKDNKKGKKRGWFARIFKGCKKDDYNGGSPPPPGTAC
ncbi:hypothetical protein SCAR479_04947 [Seiridium cardinale]|uniref:Uncharacterized protein n=1 Tax=Seiridium cardinale TaxID=138064 RepID=A0ABR2Y4S9_9PEZI